MVVNGCSDLAGFSATQGAAPNRDPQLRLSEGILMRIDKLFHTHFLEMSTLFTLFSNAQTGCFLWMCELSDSFTLGKWLEELQSTVNLLNKQFFCATNQFVYD